MTAIAIEIETGETAKETATLDAAAGEAEMAEDRRRKGVRWPTGCVTSPGWRMTGAGLAAVALEEERKKCGRKTVETTWDPAGPAASEQDPLWVSPRTKR